VIYLDLLKRFWPFIVGALVLIGLWSWHLAKVDEADRAGYARAMLAADAERAVEKLKTDRRREETDRAYQTKVSDLETRVDRLLARHEPAIRMCKSTTDHMRVRDPAPSSDDATKGGGPDMRISEDPLNGSLLVYAKRCEEDREKLMAIQGWIRSLE
jgi:hypothetical protein